MGKTALHYAACNCSTQVVQILLKFGCEKNLHDIVSFSAAKLVVSCLLEAHQVLRSHYNLLYEFVCETHTSLMSKVQYPDFSCLRLNPGNKFN